MNLFDLAQADTTLKKTSSSQGGEWSGPCPFCQGTDRFSVQPYSPKGERWFCRGCGDGRWHDLIDYIQRRDGLSFPEAAQAAGKEIPAQEKVIPLTHDLGAWRSAAGELVDDCAERLHGPDGEKALAWLHGRGLNTDTLKNWCIGYNDTDRWEDPTRYGFQTDDKRVFIPQGISIPHAPDQLNAVNFRTSKASKAKVKYHLLRGSTRQLFGVETFKDFEYVFVVESELDALLVLQESAGYGVGVCSMPASYQFKKEWGRWMNSIERFILIPDNDPPGQEWADRITKQLGDMVQVARVSDGKDIGEYYQSGGNIFEFLYSALGALDKVKA